jgi:carboxypeptidase family protein/TonB-dependent receptor-like protein
MRLAALLAILLAPLAVPAQTPAAPPPGTATVAGIVYDSTAKRPLADATVQLVNAADVRITRTVTSDAAGRYTIAGVEPGVYILGFFHVKLDSLGLKSSMFRVTVRGAGTLQADLAVPSPQRVATSFCSVKSPKDTVGFLVGYVRSAGNRLPLSDATITVRWTELELRKDGIYRSTPSLSTEPSETGWFAFCGLPVGGSVIVRAAAGADSSGLFELQVPEDGLLHRDVYVGTSLHTKLTVGDSVNRDSVTTDVLRGPGRLRGRIAASNGRPIAGARVLLWGTGLEARTDDQGAFSLANLPTGTHALDVRAVGFNPAMRAVDVFDETSQAAEVALDALGITLDTVRVVAAQRLYTSQRLADFERRKKAGFGHFMDQDAIEKRNAVQASDLLRTIPGVLVLPSQRSGYEVFMRGGLAIMGSGYCRPDVYVDGIRVIVDRDMPLDFAVRPSELRAMEVYTRGSQMPAELSSLSGCGAIAFWTGPRHNAGAKK